MGVSTHTGYFTDNTELLSSGALCTSLNEHGIRYTGLRGYSNKLRYYRDLSVNLFNGKALLPHPMKRKDLCLMDIYLSCYSNHYIFNDNDISPLGETGTGMSPKSNVIAKKYMNDFKVEYKQGTTCIEGGNCFIFNCNSKKMAIIGEHSVVTSYLALEKQGKFADIAVEPKIIPTDQAIRAARNFYLQNIIEVPSDLDLCKMFIAPLTNEDRETFYEAAQQYETYFRYTKQQIALELEVSQEDLVIVPQEDFHIDMTMTVSPAGEVLLNDHNEVLNFIGSLMENSELTPEEIEKINKYKISAQIAAQNFNSQFQETKRILEEHNIPYRTIAGIFHDNSETSGTNLNFCNGVFYQGRFYTTGPTTIEKRIYDLYVSYFKKMTGFDLIGIPNLSQVVHEFHGGLHCFVTERYSHWPRSE